MTHETSHTTNENEAELAQLASQGDSSALMKLYENYFDGIYRYFYLRVGRVSDAEDLTTETFTRAVEALFSGRYTWRGKPFGAWLFGIASNLLKEHSREMKKTSLIELPNPDLEYEEPKSEDESVLDSIIRKDERSELWRLVGELSPAEQSVLILRHVDKLSYAEIAQRLNRSVNACKQIHYRSLQNLKSKAEKAELWSEFGRG